MKSLHLAVRPWRRAGFAPAVVTVLLLTACGAGAGGGTDVARATTSVSDATGGPTLGPPAVAGPERTTEPTFTGPTFTGPTFTGPTFTGPTFTGPTGTGPTGTGPTGSTSTGSTVAGGVPTDDARPPTTDPSPAPPLPRPPLVAPADPAATPAPAWLGTRALGPPGSGPLPPQTTPPELLDRRIVTDDVLPPPPDEQFRSSVSSVPAAVLARSTWQPACPVAAADLRYLQVSFWGFDGRPHTGEVLLHSDAVDAVTAAFRAMHADRFPLEEVRVVRAEELDAAPTGDGNVTSVFVCRPVAGGGRWSEHAYGRALDVNPFHNPYERGQGAERVVIPELATAYTDRDRLLPGMLTDTSAAVRVLREAGWTWGGDYRSLKDWQHFSATGR